MEQTFFYHGATAPSGPRPTHYRWFIITLRYSALGRTPLHERSARLRDFYLTIYNTHNRHPCYRRDSNPQSQQASARRRTPYAYSAGRFRFRKSTPIGMRKSFRQTVWLRLPAATIRTCTDKQRTFFVPTLGICIWNWICLHCTRTLRPRGHWDRLEQT